MQLFNKLSLSKFCSIIWFGSMIFKPRLLREKDFLTLILLQKAAEQSIDNHHRDVEQPPMEENTKPIKRPNLYLHHNPMKRQLWDFPLVLSSANNDGRIRTCFWTKISEKKNPKKNIDFFCGIFFPVKIPKGYHRLLDRRVLESSTNSWVEAGSPSINLIVLAKLAIQPMRCNWVQKPGKLNILIPQGQFLLCAVERELHKWRQIICFPCLSPEWTNCSGCSADVIQLFRRSN